MKTITVRLSDELHKKFKMYSIKKEKSMQDLIEEYIFEIIEKDEKEKWKKTVYPLQYYPSFNQNNWIWNPK